MANMFLISFIFGKINKIPIVCYVVLTNLFLKKITYLQHYNGLWKLFNDFSNKIILIMRSFIL